MRERDGADGRGSERTDGGVADPRAGSGPPDAGPDAGYAVSDADRRGVDGAGLADRLGIDDAEIRTRKRFTRLSAADEETLASLESTIDDVAPALVEEFYDHLTDNEEMREILGAPARGSGR
ncbi:protoglobin domain-containing protein [Halobaculum litoreum]|uniref:Protoglobin domain-containing protein n=1 Tax=Halobaculum litoreum TaxID=3031998 RepID=A0ABD5XT96_9EURY